MIKRLKWVTVDSSAINAVAYNRERKVLHVEFRRGVIYSYSGIGYHRYKRLITAESVGQYYNQAIRPEKGVKHGDGVRETSVLSDAAHNGDVTHRLEQQLRKGE